MKLAWISVPQTNEQADDDTRATLKKINDAAPFFDGFIVVGGPFSRVPGIVGVWRQVINEVLRQPDTKLIHGRRLWEEWDTDIFVNNVYDCAFWARDLGAIEAEAIVLDDLAIADVEPYGKNGERWKNAIAADPGRVASAIARCGVQLDYVTPVGSNDPGSYKWALQGVGAQHGQNKCHKVGDVNQPVALNPPWATPGLRFDAWISWIDPNALTVPQAIEVWRQVKASDKYPDTKDFIAYSDPPNTAAMLEAFGDLTN